MRAILCAAALLAATPALAIDKAYIGSWTREPGQCDFSGAGPFRITVKGLEEHEADCRFKGARRDSTGWSVQLACASEGDTNTVRLHWQLLPNGHLKEIAKDRTTDFVRCP